MKTRIRSHILSSYLFPLMAFIIIFQISLGAQAGFFIKDFAYQVTFPQRIIMISEENNEFVVSEQLPDTKAKIPLMAVSKIKFISKFEGTPKQDKFDEYIVKRADGQMDAPSTWFLLGTEKGYQFLRKSMKTAPKTAGAIHHVFTMSGDGNKPEKVSVGMVNDPMAGAHFIFSIKPFNGPGETVIVREADLKAQVLADHYVEVAAPGEGRLQIANSLIKFKNGEEFHLALPAIHVNDLPGDKLVGDKPVMKEVARPLPAVHAEVAATHAELKAAVQSAAPVAPVETRAPAPVQAEAPAPAPEVARAPAAPASFHFQYDDYDFTLSMNEDGTFLTRQKDGLKVKISSVNLNTSHERFKVEAGIFSYSTARKIDLDAFHLEAHMHWVPAIEKPKAPKTPQEEAEEKKLKVNEPPVADSFEEYKETPRDHIKPIEARESLISMIIDNLSLPRSRSTILTGESGDIPDVVGEAIARFPRTWKVYELDSASFGSGLGTSGAKEQKILDMQNLSKKAVTIFYAEDFETLKGLGAVTGDTRDALMLLRKPIKNGVIKVIGTGRDDFKQRVADPSIVQAMDVKQVETLTPSQVVEAIKGWMRHEPKFADIDYSHFDVVGPRNFNPISYIMKTARDFNVSEMDPNRSIKLLEKVKLPLTKEKIDLAAKELYSLDPSFTDRKAKLGKLSQLVEKLNQKILGHQHLKENLYQQTRKQINMQHDRKGPAVRLWLEGPPGVGKTELATEYAKAMGLEYDIIEMRTIRDSDQLMSRIRKQLDKSPFSVIILDEAEKVKDLSVYQSMLTMMNQETFTYTEETGEKKTFTMSASNAKVFVTSNLTDDLIVEFWATLTDEQKDMSEVELSRRFFEMFPITEMVEHMVKRGMPSPFVDRFATVENGISFAFPPSTNVMMQLLKLKLESKHAAVETEWQVEILLKNSLEFCRNLAKKYRKQNLSTRTTLGELDSHVIRLRGDLYESDLYAPGSRYELDLTNGHYAELSCKNIFE